MNDARPSPLRVLLPAGWAIVLLACGASPASMATAVNEDARVGERLVETRPLAAAKRFASAGERLDTMKLLFSGHPITQEMFEGDDVGGLPRARFEARLAASRRVVGDVDLLDAAATLVDPPRRGLRRRMFRLDASPAVRLAAELKARGRPVPEHVAAHRDPPRETPPPRMRPVTMRQALVREWNLRRGDPTADGWLAEILAEPGTPLPLGERFVWARAHHRARPWHGLARYLLTEGDREAALDALAQSADRAMVEGLVAPMAEGRWLPAELARTHIEAGDRTGAGRIVARFAMGLGRVQHTPDNTVDDMAAKARTLAPVALDLCDPGALHALEAVLNSPLLPALHRRLRDPAPAADAGLDAAVEALHAPGSAARSVDGMLTPARGLVPALRARVAVAARRAQRPGAPTLMDGARQDTTPLGPADRITFALAEALWAPEAADAALGRALDDAATLPSMAERVDALIDVERVRTALDVEPGPGLRAGLARLLFAARP